MTSTPNTTLAQWDGSIAMTTPPSAASAAPPHSSTCLRPNGQVRRTFWVTDMPLSQSSGSRDEPRGGPAVPGTGERGGQPQPPTAHGAGVAERGDDYR